MRNNNKKQNDNLNYLNGGGFAARPKTLLCSICGREFGTASLEIHQKTCIKKYQNDLVNMDPGHRMQMPSSKKNYIVAQQIMQKLEQEKNYRQQGPKTGKQQVLYEQPQQVMALVACRKCGRRFNPDRIRKHESVCIGPEPDVSRIKQRQEEMNKRVARQLRPKKTGKWREEHLEFQQAMREMRKIRQQEIAEGRGNPFGNHQQSNYGRPPSKQQQYKQQSQYPKAPQQSYPKQQNYQKPPQQNYTQSVKASHKQPNFQLEQQKMKLHSRSPAPQQKQQKPVQQQMRGSVGNEIGYGRPVNQGGGGASYQIANSNVSTFSLFTSDGLPKRYDNYQASNPYAKKSGLY